MAKRKPLILKVPNEIMQDTKDYIQAEILRKLATARHMIDFDKEIAAGIYMYALEELGKLEVLKRSEQKETQYSLKYEEEFLLQRVKLKMAMEYLQKVGHPECILLRRVNNKSSFGDLSTYSFLLSYVEASLSVFHTDLEYEKTTNTATKPKDIPLVNETKLKLAVNILEDLIIKWS